MHTKDIIFNKKIFYNLAELNIAYIIKLTEVIKILNFKPPIIENLPYNTDSKDNKIIKLTKDIQRNQPNTGLSKGVEK